MQKELIFEGKTLDLAIKSACANLCVAEDDLSQYEVITTGKKGFLGFGGENAKIRVFVEMTAEEEKEALKKEKEALETKKQQEVKKESKDSKEIKEVKKESKEVKVEKVESKESKDSKEDLSEYEKRARDFIEPLCEKILGQKADVKIEMDGRNMNIDISGENMGVLIGRRGETLDSIQYLTSLAINKRDSGLVKVKIDTENYRQKREKTLEELAIRTAKKVLKSRRNFTFEPMPPYERRIIHSTLQNVEGVTTYSVGQEPKRKVVITIEKHNNRAVQKGE